MKLLSYVPFVFVCTLLLQSCNTAQSAPPWDVEQATAKPENTADTSYSVVIGVSGTVQNSAKASPAETAQAVKRMQYKDLYDIYVKNKKTITCDYKGQKLEVLVEILGKDDAVVSCPVVVGLDAIEFIKPRDSNLRDLTNYENALTNQFSLDTNCDKYNTDDEVRKKIDKMEYDNMQLVKNEFGYQYDWQTRGKAGAISWLIKKLPDELLASKQYDFQIKVDDKTAWALANAIVKKTAEQGGVEDSFIPMMERSLTQWKSRWVESLIIKYCQLFDGIGTIAFTNGAISEFASDSPFNQAGLIKFDNAGVSYRSFRLYRVVRRTERGENALITPECAMDSAMQWLNHGGVQYKNLNMEPTHIQYAYYPMNSAEGVDYKKGEWLMVPCCFVYFNMEDGSYATVCQINALTGKVY